MQDLTLVGLTGDRLVLISDSGEEFSLPADARLRAALRGEHARFGQLEIQMDSALRPRDIQNRIRSGESPEDVAAAAKTTVDKIMGFAMPVLAERAHIAGQAQRSSVRRKTGEGGARNLGDAVAERLRSRNVRPDSVEWDAWRREDGRWTLVADYRSGEQPRHAEFTYDAPGRYVVADDDEARWLVGEPQATVKGPQPRSTGTPGRRLTAVADQELPLGEDAIGMVSGTHPDEQTVDLSAAADAVRSSGSRPERSAAGAEEDRSVDDADDIRAPHRDTADADWIASTPRAAERTEPAAADDGPAPEPEDEQREEPKRPARKKGRASVPSWDEIMFGGKSE